MPSNIQQALRRGLSLFRVVVPTWRFFEEPSLNPALSVRIHAPGAGFGGWQLCEPALGHRTPWMLWFNPAANLAMLNQELLERAIQEASEQDGAAADEFSRSATYEMVRRLAAEYILVSGQGTLQAVPGATFQFKVSDEGRVTTDVIISREYSL